MIDKINRLFDSRQHEMIECASGGPIVGFCQWVNCVTVMTCSCLVDDDISPMLCTWQSASCFAMILHSPAFRSGGVSSFRLIPHVLTPQTYILEC